MSMLVWVGFFVIYIGVLALDLVVLHRESKEMSVRQAHEVVEAIELARARAIRGARSPDHPAMFTIINGVMLILFFSLLQTLVVGLLLGWYWALLYFATLIAGAYWAAFADHPAEARGKGIYEG